MPPEAAVVRLAEIVAARAEFTEDDIYTAMAAAGIPDPVADRAYKFTQIAWGRVLLNGLGVRFSSEYICFNGAGEVIETGRLADQPHFAAATSAAGRYAGEPGFQRLALMAVGDGLFLRPRVVMRVTGERVIRTRLVQTERYVVAVEVEMVVPPDDLSEPRYEVEMVQLLRQVRERTTFPRSTSGRGVTGPRQPRYTIPKRALVV